MPDKRPFVDRRIGFKVLLKGSRAPLSEMADGKLQDEFNKKMDRNGIGIYSRHTKVKDNPPQADFIIQNSHISADNVEDVENILDMMFTNLGLNVQRVDVVAYALSPGDKVRNAMGV